MGHCQRNMLPVALTFPVLIEVCGRNARRFTRAVVVLKGGGIGAFAGSSKARLPSGFVADIVLDVVFAGAFRVGSLPFDVPFLTSSGCSPSVEIEVVL